MGDRAPLLQEDAGDREILVRVGTCRARLRFVGLHCLSSNPYSGTNSLAREFHALNPRRTRRRSTKWAQLQLAQSRYTYPPGKVPLSLILPSLILLLILSSLDSFLDSS